MKKKKTILIILFLSVVIGLIFTIYRYNNKTDYITSIKQLNNPKYIVGVSEGTQAMYAAEKQLRQSQIKYFSNDNDGYVSLKSGKIDAFVHDYTALKYAEKTNQYFVVMPDTLGEIDIAVGINPKRKDLVPKINSFINKYKQEKIADDMYQRWFELFQDEMSDIPKAKNPTGTLKVGVNGLIQPSSFYGADGKLKGHNIEFIQRLAYDLNMDYELNDLPFDSLIMGLKSNKLDIVVANLNVTEERKKSVNFSEPYLVNKTGVLVLKKRLPVSENQDKTVITNLSQLEGKKVGVLMGSIFDKVLKEDLKTAIPIYFDNVPDELIALSQGKIDGVLLDSPTAKSATITYKGLGILEQNLLSVNYSFMFSKKNESLKNTFDSVLKEFREKGLLDRLNEKWFGSNESAKILPEKLGERNNPVGEFNMAVNSTYPPFVYLKDNRYAGYEVEIAHLMAKKLGYSLNIQDIHFASIIPSVMSGKSDFAASGIAITDERAKSVLFGVPDYEAGIVMVVRNDENVQKDNFLKGIKSSFLRTFITEKRYKLILGGLGITIVITMFSLIFGTLLGCIICALRRSDKRKFNIPAKVYITAIQGTPILVLLLIMYYIIFANIQWNPVIIAVIAFSINFAAYSAEIFRSGLDAISKGQLEAAEATGFNRIQIFNKIIIPQALKHILPVYRGLAIDILKTTSIVGYIAIQDLTKMSDIIRSRTYEAFFPIISTAILYFVLAYLFAELLKHYEFKLNPKYRKRVIKGIEVKDYANY